VVLYLRRVITIYYSAGIRNAIRIRVPKLRRTGQTGEAGWSYFDSISGRLELGHDPASGPDNDF